MSRPSEASQTSGFAGGMWFGLVDDDAENISSIGLGFTWRPVDWFNAELFYGHALDIVQEPDEKEWQDKGFHFSIHFDWPMN